MALYIARGAGPMPDPGRYSMRMTIFSGDDFVGEPCASVGIDVQSAGLTPDGELGWVEIDLFDDMPELHKFAESLFGPIEPFLPAEPSGGAAASVGG